MARKRVLLVVEGEKQEVRLFRALFASYQLDLDYEICPYRTNIYELYERMFANGMQDDLSLLGVLKERASAEDRRMFDQDYSDVFLVFDYEPQDDRFSPNRLEEMQRYFNESTDNGKLFVNYPMVEACKHFLKMPDRGFIDRAVSFDEVRRYKQIVGNAGRYQSYERDFKRPDVDKLIALTAFKASRLSGRVLGDDRASSYGSLDHEAVLKAQNRSLKTDNKIWVLGMCLLLILEYSSDLIDIDEMESLLLS